MRIFKVYFVNKAALNIVDLAYTEATNAYDAIKQIKKRFPRSIVLNARLIERAFV